MKKNIFVIHAGGTISMLEDAATGAVQPSSENPHEQRFIVTFNKLEFGLSNTQK